MRVVYGVLVQMGFIARQEGLAFDSGRWELALAALALSNNLSLISGWVYALVKGKRGNNERVWGRRRRRGKVHLFPFAPRRFQVIRPKENGGKMGYAKMMMSLCYNGDECNIVLKPIICMLYLTIILFDLCAFYITLLIPLYVN